MMWRRVVLVVASLQATVSQAYAPIRMVSGHGKGLVVLPKGIPGTMRGAIMSQKLSVRNPTANDTPSSIPLFTAKLDQTIAWDEMDWCVEASGNKPGDAIRLNSCSGAQTQKWTWIPDGRGHHMIQLKDTELCLDAIDKKAGLSGAPLELLGCGSKVARWQFEETFPLPGTLQGAEYSYGARHSMIALLALAGVGAISFGAWLWQWVAKLKQDREMIPAVMAISPIHPSRAAQPRASRTNDTIQMTEDNASSTDEILQQEAALKEKEAAMQKNIEDAMKERESILQIKEDAMKIKEEALKMKEDVLKAKEVDLEARLAAVTQRKSEAAPTPPTGVTVTVTPPTQREEPKQVNEQGTGEMFQKALDNPKLMNAMNDIALNGPSAMQKYTNDPEIMAYILEIQTKRNANPKAKELEEIFQNSPKIQKAMEDMRKNGPMAMMKYTGDKEVMDYVREMQKLTSI